jgi:hypothetical protein
VLWRGLSAGPTVVLGAAPIRFVSSYNDYQDDQLGTPLPPTLATRFARHPGDSAFLAREPRLFVVRRVAFAGSVAIVLRVPSMYDPSAFELWLVRRSDLRVTGPIPIVDNWGDAGEHIDDRASLRMVGGRPVLTMTRCSQYYDIEAEDEPRGPEVYTDSVAVARWQGDSFAVPAWIAATPTLLRGSGLRTCHQLAEEE